MPRFSDSVPKYRKHKASGNGIVTLNAVDQYLGPHGALPNYDDLRRAANVPKTGQCRWAPVINIAELLTAGVAKTLLGKAVVADELSFLLLHVVSAE